MKLTTILKALDGTFEEMATIERRRGIMGIAVDTDASALQWQKRNRQNDKFYDRILERLYEIDNQRYGK